MHLFDTHSLTIRPCHLVEVGTPPEDVDRILAAVIAVDPLAQGPNYDCVSFQSAPGVERYRPREGAVAGTEEGVRARPGVVFLRFEIEADAAGLQAVLEAIYQIHCYQEPTIRLYPCLTARTRGRDDRANPNRWWNREGDWMKRDAS